MTSFPKMYYLLVFVILNFSAKGFAQEQSPVTIIPQPQSIRMQSGSFTINENSQIIVPSNAKEYQSLGKVLADDILRRTGFSLPVLTTKRKDNVINIALGKLNDSLGTEGYTLNVGAKSINLKASAYAGLFYGIQTINKLLPASPVHQVKVSIPGLEIADYPRFEWRGLMIDVGRYYYPIDFLKKYIDYMSQNKLNVFHWHLVEDGGWRIEIKKYPKLTAIGSKRTNTQISKKPQVFNNEPHEGFYTQDEVRDLVAYAQERFVTIVPEIEMPGHTVSALAAYPELSCTGGPFEVQNEWKIRADIYCGGNEQTYKFLEDVLTEVADLFPGQYIHIGGDEALKDQWKVCPKCQAKIKAEGLKDEHGLQSYFIRRIENFLSTKNKRIIGWDEILEGGLAPNAAVMSWRGTKGGIAAAKQHHDVVMTPNVNMYFDYYQGEKSLEPFAISGNLYLDKVYNYNPVPDELSTEEKKYIKGVQANLWAEYIHTPLKMEYMTWPRASALAEVAWTNPSQKNLNRFMQKLDQEYLRFEADGVNYSRSAFNPIQEVKIDAKIATVTLKDNGYNSQIYYTLDGSMPTVNSTLYTVPFRLTKSTTVKSAVFAGGKIAGKVLEKVVEIK